jgi:D-alanyl-D-alanine carboxypeptidase
MDSIVAAGMGSSSTPGVVIGVWDPGVGAYVHAFGTSDVSTGAPISVVDRFRIASITKTFTATAILRLVDEHRLSLGAHLGAFVPGIENGGRITIAELLNMTAGVYNYTEDPSFISGYFSNPLLPFAAQDALAIIRRHEAPFKPGEHVEYSDSNYVLLELVAEKVTGEPLAQLIQQQILDPLKLTDTSYPTTSRMPSPFTHGYLTEPVGRRDVTLSNPGVAGGAGAMISALDDLKVWAKALATGSLLSQRLQRLRLRIRPLATGKVTLGYGMGIMNLNGFVGHNGGILGYGTAMLYLPSKHATIIVEANNDNVSANVPTGIFIGLASYLFPHQFPRGS